MNSKEFHFDDEKGNNFNIIVNQYHMTPVNPMNNLMNLMTLAALSNNMNPAIQIADKKENMIESAPMHRYPLGIENDSTKVKYEIVDEDLYEIQFKSMRDIPDSIYVEILMENNIDLCKFIKDYKSIMESVKYKLASVSSINNNFAFGLNIQNIGLIKVMNISSNYFTKLIEKFGKNNKSVFFSDEIGIKLNMPFLQIIKEMDFIIDSENLFSINYKTIDNKFHIKQEDSK